MQISSMQSNPKPDLETRIHQAAQQLETNFVAEMLKYTQLHESSDSFGGGAGEDHFKSFFINEQAKKIVDSGGIGLTEAIFNSMWKKIDEQK